jgi:SpoVK/Ycf46/Vps4 family AAA+-type ATPase
MRSVLKELLNNDVLQEFHGTKIARRDDTGWDMLLDSDLGSSTDCCRTIKSVLEERVIRPFETSITNPSVGVSYSVILFGTPGTAKTTITEATASKMGWNFVVIDTSVFLADGVSNIAARIQYVFRRLQALRNCVILFDEIEEFCLDRENPNLSMQSRMLTTAMLTAINDLRRKKESVFFIATNRLRAFDSAIIRPGK